VIDGILETERPWGAVVAFGGQTAIKLTKHLSELRRKYPRHERRQHRYGAEDRERFDEMLSRFNIPRAAGRTVFTCDEALAAANTLGYPVLLRPSYVLGGQNMIIAYNDDDVNEYMGIILRQGIENPVLIDKYLMGKEVEVDAICDGEDLLVPGIMEHIERAGVHSGDSISVYPAQTLTQAEKDTILDYTCKLAKALNVVGLVNAQFVIYNHTVYVIEVNPRSSRTVPYISKVTGVPMVDLATRCLLGQKLRDLGCGTGLHPAGDYVAVKVPVFSFAKLSDVDTLLGPEMKSTGEVLGIAKTFHEALLKGLTAAGYRMKKRGGVMLTVRDSDKQELIPLAARFEKLGYTIYATSGTANTLNKNMIATNAVRKLHEPHPNIMELLESGKIDYVVSTSSKGRIPQYDDVKLRRKAVERSIPCLTSLDTARALLTCLEMDSTIDDVALVDITRL
jgi:carbamoyl-phosphate synthase large subunit